MKLFIFAVAFAATSLAVAKAAVSAATSPGLRGAISVSDSVPTLPNGISCRFCPDDDNYRFEYPSGSDWNNWHRALADDKAGGDRELTSTDKLKASAKAAHYEAHFLQHAASKQVKEEHKRALQAAAALADKEASLLVDAVNAGDLEDHDRILKEKMLPNDISCRFCPDDDNYRADVPTDADRELSSTDMLKATAQVAHYEAHFLQHAASKQTKEEHKRALQDAAAQANEEAAMLVHAVKTGDVKTHDRILKEKMLPNDISCRFCPDDDNYRADVPAPPSDREMKEIITLPNGISCRFCPDDDNYRNILDDHGDAGDSSWAHWH